MKKAKRLPWKGRKMGKGHCRKSKRHWKEIRRLNARKRR